MPTVFISGATGYLGCPLSQLLVQRGYDVHALTRPQSIRKLPIGCRPVPGNALDVESFQHTVPLRTTFIHLTGVAHPSPAKAKQFRDIDQVSFRASLAAAIRAHAKHFLYVSVAHPAPVMQAYIDVRQTCEAELIAAGLNATILRPWYILGKGHRWPYALVPFYKLAETIPAWRPSAQRLGLVTHTEMLAALVYATQTPPTGVRILDVPAIRAAAAASPSALSPELPPSPSGRRSHHPTLSA